MGIETDRAVYTVKEVATLLGLGRNSTYECINRGEIPSIRLGKRLLIPKSALERILEESNQRIANHDD